MSLAKAAIQTIYARSLTSAIGTCDSFRPPRRKGLELLGIAVENAVGSIE